MPKQRQAPSRRELLEELQNAEQCMRKVAGQWAVIPLRWRLTLLNCANTAERILVDAGLR